MQTDGFELDKLDLHILTILAKQPLWKQKLYDILHDRADTSVSLQTVGRRIETLRDHDYVNPRILDPDDTPRKLILAFTPSDKARTALTEHRICHDCGTLLAPSDHVHQLESATAYFADP